MKRSVKTLQIQSCVSVQPFQDLVEEEVPTFVAALNAVVLEEEAEITNSTATIAAIVEILNTVANISTAVNESVAQVRCLCICPDLLKQTNKQKKLFKNLFS